jgi:hypothetical protein
MNPSFEHAHGLEHWITSPLSDRTISVVTAPAYPDNYAQGGSRHALLLTPIEGPGFHAAPNATTHAAVSQRLRVCPDTKYQLVFQFRWSGAGAVPDAGAACQLYFSFAGADVSSSAWSALNPTADAWTQVTIASTTPRQARWVYLTLGVKCPAAGKLVGTAMIDSLNLTM